MFNSDDKLSLVPTYDKEKQNTHDWPKHRSIRNSMPILNSLNEMTIQNFRWSIHQFSSWCHSKNLLVSFLTLEEMWEIASSIFFNQHFIFLRRFFSLVHFVYIEKYTYMCWNVQLESKECWKDISIWKLFKNLDKDGFWVVWFITLLKCIIEINYTDNTLH